ncbi:hypothetical protein [Brevundimonas kwangchunensis]|uniref:hypothetical protein n=1 Tax=Brevundimonas kwangchunensis TaxID=322163 RepID=UPI0031D25B99
MDLIQKRNCLSGYFGLPRPARKPSIVILNGTTVFDAPAWFSAAVANRRRVFDRFEERLARVKCPEVSHEFFGHPDTSEAVIKFD